MIALITATICICAIILTYNLAGLINPYTDEVIKKTDINSKYGDYYSGYHVQYKRMYKNGKVTFHSETVNY